jgi:hypothetical protein
VVDVLEKQTHVTNLRLKAERCRSLARSITDGRTVANLTSYASELEQEAEGLESERRSKSSNGSDTNSANGNGASKGPGANGVNGAVR